MAEINNYDRVADSYDALSRLIFRNSLVEAQQYLLPLLAPPCTLLIVGGGTGWILEEIRKVYPADVHITYIEISAQMIRLAEKRDSGKNQVRFVHLPVEEFESDHAFDAVMTPFLFDNFSSLRAQHIFSRLNHLLMPGGTWLFTDFHMDKDAGKVWQKVLLQCMYWFFRLTSHIEASQLPDMDSLFEKAAYQKSSEKFFFKNFIRSCAYKKPVS